VALRDYFHFPVLIAKSSGGYEARADHEVGGNTLQGTLGGGGVNNGKAVQYLAAAFGVALLSMQPMSALGGDQAYNDDSDTGAGDRLDKRIKRIRGVTVTGVNSVRGKPFFSWGGPFATFNFPDLFVYNEHGTEPLLIDENTPDSAIVATGVSPEYLFIRGQTASVIPPGSTNLPLRNVPINIDFNYVKRVPLRGLLQADPLELSQSEPANPITLGQWMKASGVAVIDCSGEGATVKLRLKSLIPNRIYSAWATMTLPAQVGQPGVNSFPLPIGGTPGNIFLTDKNGDATFERWIKFCPFDTQSTGGSTPSIPALDIEVLYHADFQAYGAIPAPGLMLGLITFDHLVFPIGVELLNN
jgi:hypothetical protein